MAERAARSTGRPARRRRRRFNVDREPDDEPDTIEADALDLEPDERADVDDGDVEALPEDDEPDVDEVHPPARLRRAAGPKARIEQDVAAGRRQATPREVADGQLPWWATASREEFSQEAERRAAEMSQSKEGRRVKPTIGMSMAEK